MSASIGYNSRMQPATLAYTKQSTKLLELAYSYTPWTETLATELLPYP